MTTLEEIRARVKEDKSFADSLREAKTAEEVLGILHTAGFDVSLEEIEKAGEISDNELDNVSGGYSKNDLEFLLFHWPKY